MLRISDVDIIRPYVLALRFSDGFYGEVDLSEVFQQPPFDQVADFGCFVLECNALGWGEMKLSVGTLRQLASVSTPPTVKQTELLENIEAEIKQAAWEAMITDRPEILQATIRSYVEHYGHSRVVKTAGIKSRTSAYRSLQDCSSPRWETLVKMAHATLKMITHPDNKPPLPCTD